MNWRTVAAVLGALCALWCGAVQAQSPPVDAPATAQDVIAKMLARNAGLNSYQVRVHVQMHSSIPFVNPKLDGTSYYKRPTSFAVVFDRVPGYAKGFQKLFDDVADPIGWEKDSNIKLQGMGALNGRPMIVLVLTKKIYSDQIKDTTVYVDPTTYELPEMDWHYTNGGTIVMKQYYQMEDGFSLVTRQHVDIDYRVHAHGDSQYDIYKTNVPVDDAVFKQ